MFSRGLPGQFGFRSGEKGTHTSRTIMLNELSILLDGVAQKAGRADYLAAIIGNNALSKRTAATRVLTAQRLTELYALESNVPLFRVLRQFWQDDTPGRPLLAVLCALA